MYQRLREAILVGEMHAGERLTEERLADLFAVSRTPVRELLARLAAEGLVELLPFRGARVRHFTPEEIRGIYDLRALLESYAARQGCRHLTPADLAAIAAINDEMDEAATLLRTDGRVEDLRQVVDANQRFHRLLTEASGNRYLITTLQQLIQLPLVYRSFQWFGAEGLAQSVRQHAELIAALRQRDPDYAEAVMRIHIYHGRDALFRHMDELRGEDEVGPGETA